MNISANQRQLSQGSQPRQRWHLDEPIADVADARRFGLRCLRLALLWVYITMCRRSRISESTRPGSDVSSRISHVGLYRSIAGGLLHRLPLELLVSVLLLFAIPTRTEAQQPFVHGSDILFRIRIDRKGYNIDDKIVIHYTIKNISNGAMYAPRSQWEVKCGNPPHLWSLLEDSSGKHYEPGYGGSCLGPIPPDRMSLRERMQMDAVLLKPGQEATGFSFESEIFAEKLKPGVYRLEAILYGWNLPFDNSQLHELTLMGAPFLGGETDAFSQIELHRGAK